MGTRSTVYFLENGEVIGAIYRQYDGYPTGMGDDIKKILTQNGTIDPVIRNGYSFGDQIPTHFNGISCLGAYLIGELKNGIGNVYLYNPDWKTEAYHYDIYAIDGRVHMTLHYRYTDYNDGVLYDGPVVDYDGTEVERMLNEFESGKE